MSAARKEVGGLQQTTDTHKSASGRLSYQGNIAGVHKHVRFVPFAPPCPKSASLTYLGCCI